MASPHRLASDAGNHESDLQGIAIQRPTFRQNRLLPARSFRFKINGFGFLHGRLISFAAERLMGDGGGSGSPGPAMARTARCYQAFVFHLLKKFPDRLKGIKQAFPITLHHPREPGFSAACQ
jgi:hypothetical protein